MATTTLATARDSIAAVLEALTPASLADKPFRRCPGRYRLKQWATEQAKGSNVLRRFDLVRGAGDEAAWIDPTSVERNDELLLTVAYPASPPLYGANELADMDSIVRADARMLRDAIFASENYPAGVYAQFVVIEPLDESSSDVWFQELRITVIYREAQTLP